MSAGQGEEARTPFDRIVAAAVREGLSAEAADDLALAVLADLRLEPHERRYWHLYNADQGAYRMTLDEHQAHDRRDAEARMAPYHHAGDGYEVIERVQRWWSTPGEWADHPPLFDSTRVGDQ